MKKLITQTIIILIIGFSFGLNVAQAQTIELQNKVIDGQIKDLYQQMNALNEEVKRLKEPAGITEEDLELLSKLIYTEARGESFEGQVAVAAVVLNRLKSQDFPKSIREVIYSENQFNGVKNLKYVTPTEKNIRAAKRALMGFDPTNGAVFYWTKNTKGKWFRSREVKQVIGNHQFCS
ncbi:MAG: Spore cortex-lytic enzyme [Candidatus Dichloromethanomonas elyunquensis]|nr:MAG: Spore cortex-lytic enzyme [Candidatus Dichloromethanomonas elyunquensis]